MWALVPLKLVLELEIWLELRVFASWPSISANCLLVLLLQWNFDCEQVEEVDLLNVKLVMELVAGASSKSGSLFTQTGETIQLGSIIWDEDLRNDQFLW